MLLKTKRFMPVKCQGRLTPTAGYFAILGQVVGRQYLMWRAVRLGQGMLYFVLIFGFAHKVFRAAYRNVRNEHDTGMTVKYGL